ncbi:MAG: phosphatidylglycerol lysyltransferase domain-containing protein [Desulfonatronovibrio sp.]
MKFEPVTMDLQHDYIKFLHKTPQLASDFSFANIYGWTEEYGLEIAFDQELAWIRQNNPEKLYWAPVGNWDINWQKATVNLPESRKIVRIPEKLAAIWQDRLPEINIQSDRDQWDYLYSVTELIQLRGNRFHKKKNLYNQFIKNYDYTYVELGQKNIEEVLALQTEWCLWKECEDSPALEAENKAIVRVLSRWEDLQGLFGAGLMVEGEMVAYTVAEALTDTTVLIHFEKGCPEHKGVYQAINKIFLEKSAGGFEMVNREQDLGDPGLKKAKESYNPTGYLKKYIAEM